MRRRQVLALVAALLVVAAARPATQTPVVHPFREWQVSSEYTQSATGKKLVGRIGLLQHRATGACWIVYPGAYSSVAPAPKEVCGP